MYRFFIFTILLTLYSCSPTQEKPVQTASVTSVDNLSLTKIQADRLASLPLACIQQEYPNKLNQTLGNETYLKRPKELHPTFYGCFDWHSAVHGHWSLVKLLKEYPNLKDADKAKKMLLENISPENITNELRYWDDKYNSSYERTYGWAWLLKLAEELHTWDVPLARKLEANIKPMTDMIVGKYIEFLPKLVYPIRVGEHTNTAFGLSFALDYAHTVGDTILKELIESRSKDFYMNDASCPISWEPSGFDFLSPCLEEAGLMARVLDNETYKNWINQFLPQLLDSKFKIDMGQVSDRSDGKLVHLDGVNFSRAWNLFTVSKKLGGINNLDNLANQHIEYSLPNLVGDDYEGGHWLGSFAIYALSYN